VRALAGDRPAVDSSGFHTELSGRTLIGNFALHSPSGYPCILRQFFIIECGRGMELGAWHYRGVACWPILNSGFQLSFEWTTMVANGMLEACMICGNGVLRTGDRLDEARSDGCRE
jgi:hypothetical protein